MPSGFAGGPHDQFNVALAVERAGVPDIAVVIDYMDNIRSFAPTHALQMNPKRRADRAAADVKRQGRGLDPEVPDLLAARGFNSERMRTAEIVRRIEAEFGATLDVGPSFGDYIRCLLPAAPGHAVADDTAPIKLEVLAWRKAFAVDRHGLIDARERRRRDQLARRRQVSDHGLCLCLRRGRQNRWVRRDRKRNGPARTVGSWVLLHIAVRKGKFAMQ